MKLRTRSILGSCCVVLSSFGCGRGLETETPELHYQRFVLVQVEQPAQGCGESLVAPCATVVLALDTKTGQVCRAASLHGENYPLCLRLYESYPDSKAEVAQLKDQIKTDMANDWASRPAASKVPSFSEWKKGQEQAPSQRKGEPK
jgi:hypothetical protein